MSMAVLAYDHDPFKTNSPSEYAIVLIRYLSHGVLGNFDDFSSS